MIWNVRLKWFIAIVMLALPAAAADTIDTVAVGNPGNTDDTRYETPGYGGVDYEYRIAKYEVTNTQYAEFLNNVAASADPHGLYNPSMGSGYGGITRSGSSDNYTYSTIEGRGNMPVNYVSFWDATRFSNWLHNGQGSGDTETGAYTLTAYGIANNTVTRNSDWQWAVTSEDEWYKAAYHKNDGDTSNYFDYPTSNDLAPTAEYPPGGSNSVNDLLAVGDLTNVGAYTSSESPYDTFDQGGNVWEWNDTIIVGLVRGRRGSSFYCDPSTSSLHASQRHGAGALDEHLNLGFRVASIPEPGSITLLVCGLVAGLICWRRRK